jgi:SAM-dependent methyltransferase
VETREAAAAGIDSSRPSIARAYDYLLGGKDNFAVDRAMAEQILRLYPDTGRMCRDNRAFITRTVTWAARQGIGQFLDLGSGLPTSPAVHETAGEVIPGARTCYVDNDPMAVLHIRALMVKWAGSGVAAAGHDLADVPAVLTDPDVTSVLSFREPVCVTLASVLHFWEAGRAREIVQSYVSRLAPGSAVVISCMRNDDPALFGQSKKSYTAAGVYNHTREEMESLFAGLELVPPGLALADAWRGGMPAVPHKPAGAAYILGGVGLKR